MTETSRITVGGDAPYDIVVGNDVLESIVGLVPDTATRVAIFHAPHLSAYVSRVRGLLEQSQRQVIQVELPDAEQAKTSSILERSWSALADAGFTRTDCVVAIGGGATTDVGGFVAATWLRGVPLIQVPTTLLGMVDAAIGGKTGINIAQGKNLVGSFYAPTAVLCDLAVLPTMPKRDYLAGMGEVVKYGFIADPEILNIIENDPQGACDPAGPHVGELVRRSAQVKADVVTADFKEVSGTRAGGSIGREVLNYGHTLGHAIERNENYTWRHGDAISVGMVFAAELSQRSGHLSVDDVARHRAVLQSLGLPTTYRDGQWEALLKSMGLDKKTRGNQLRFVILDGVARPLVLAGPDEDAIAASYQAIVA